MRAEFRGIVAGWTLTSGVGDLGEMIEDVDRWSKSNGPLEPDELATLRLMVECQVARGIARGDFEPFIAGETTCESD